MVETSKVLGKEKLELATDVSLAQSVSFAFEDVARYAIACSGHKDVHVGVHEFRKSLRRLRTVTRWLEDSRPDVSWSALRTNLRSVFLLTNPLRDAHVLDEIADAVEARAKAKPEAGVLAEDWRRSLRVPAHPPEDGFVAPVLARAAAEVPALVHEFLEKIPDDLSVKDLRRGVRRAYGRARKTRDRALNSYEFEPVHDFRKRVKELRYVMEAVASANVLVEPVLEDLAGLAKALGRATDLELLLQHVEEDGPVTDVIRAQLEDALEAAFEISGPFFAPSSSEFARATTAVLGGKFALE